MFRKIAVCLFIFTTEINIFVLVRQTVDYFTGTCVDIWEPSLCKEYKIANKCAWTRFNPLGNCARTCGDCEQCNLPCSASK